MNIDECDPNPCVNGTCMVISLNTYTFSSKLSCMCRTDLTPIPVHVWLATLVQTVILTSTSACQILVGMVQHVGYVEIQCTLH